MDSSTSPIQLNTTVTGDDSEQKLLKSLCLKVDMAKDRHL